MCPPGTDQTMRSRQQWQILAPRIRKIYRGRRGPRDFSSDFDPTYILFNDRSSINAWTTLAKPGTCSSKKRFAVHTNHPRHLSRLESLPTELLDIVFDSGLLEKTDVMALGLTSRRLWLHALRYVDKDCSRATAPLAGVEIAWTGTYLTDLPAPFEKDDLARSSEHNSYGGNMPKARRVNWDAIETYQPISCDHKARWEAALADHDMNAAGIDAQIAADLTKDLSSTFPLIPDSLSNAWWVFRNLTTREYVRCHPGPSLDAETTAYIDHPDAKSIQLRVDDILIMHICWTLVRGQANSTARSILRGSWAGHCFDIVPFEQDITSVSDGWKDCTDEIVEKACEIHEELKPEIEAQKKRFVWLEECRKQAIEKRMAEECGLTKIETTTKKRPRRSKKIDELLNVEVVA